MLNKVSKIDDPRLTDYVNRQRNGATQVFYTGDDPRDFTRYRCELGGIKPNVKMHNKPDTIEIAAPEKHLYAELIEGEWWWVNGCGPCNGEERGWGTYIECEKHDVCRTCSIPRKQLTETPWGGSNGWQCKPCADTAAETLRATRLAEVAAKEYDEWDYYHTDKVVCPHCGTSYAPDGEVTDGKENCGVCGGEYSIEVDYTVTYTTEVVGERVVE